jgi:predicted ABC-type transport system involved in lysophospholipase L1 biosynthesis ATPase subunit
VLSIRGLAKGFSGPRPRTVLAGIDLDLAAGEYIAVRGESGIGKSTLLNLIAGLDRADAGSIAFDGVELTHGSTTTRSLRSGAGGWASSSRRSTFCLTSRRPRTWRCRCCSTARSMARRARG